MREKIRRPDGLWQARLGKGNREQVEPWANGKALMAQRETLLVRGRHAE